MEKEYGRDEAWSLTPHQVVYRTQLLKQEAHDQVIDMALATHAGQQEAKAFQKWRELNEVND